MPRALLRAAHVHAALPALARLQQLGCRGAGPPTWMPPNSCSTRLAGLARVAAALLPMRRSAAAAITSRRCCGPAAPPSPSEPESREGCSGLAAAACRAWRSAAFSRSACCRRARSSSRVCLRCSPIASQASGRRYCGAGRQEEGVVPRLPDPAHPCACVHAAAAPPALGAQAHRQARQAHRVARQAGAHVQQLLLQLLGQRISLLPLHVGEAAAHQAVLLLRAARGAARGRRASGRACALAGADAAAARSLQQAPQNTPGRARTAMSCRIRRRISQRRCVGFSLSNQCSVRRPAGGVWVDLRA